ncbi:MAG: DUF6941 family protein [Pseudonocardia sp.]
MASLDYALLAEYARVDASGLLTVVGGSFDRVTASGPNAGQQLYVALRVLLDHDEDRVPLEVRVSSPGGEYELGMSAVAEPNRSAEPVDGRFNIMMALGVVAPLPVAGRYAVRVSLDGKLERELPFVVELSEPVRP